MSMLEEFKEFAVKGNAMDLAVGVIIGGAFGKIVDSIVGDLIMPLVGKVVETMNPVYDAQLITYLKLTGIRLGFLINFNVVHLKDGIKRIVV